MFASTALWPCGTARAEQGSGPGRTEGAAPEAPEDLEAGPSSAKPDPFQPFIVEQKVAKEKKTRKPRTYLETLDLSQLDLIAIVAGPEGRWAMVRDAKGVGYVVRKGTPIGTNEGVVHEIRDDALVVREKHRDFFGRVTVKDVVKTLPATR